ncbi:MAG: CoA ester lyase [Rhodopila sp.]|nr:CoA ester lyase [Rhodopila sp.]
MWPIRSFLFVPAHRRSWVGKAIRHRPGACMLDLEDSVPPNERDNARAMLASEIAEVSAAGIGAFVRVNPDPEQMLLDVAAATVAGLTGVMLPKAATPEEVRHLDGLLSYHEGRAGLAHGGIAIMPLPETARGLQDAEQLASASARVKGLVSSISGPVSGDIARAFGFTATRGGLEQLYMNSKIVLDSRAGGAPYPICGVFGLPLDDLDGVREMARRARDIGYTGVPVMHPSHIEIVEQVFRPSVEEIAYFEGLLAAFSAAESAGAGAISYHGTMVDYAMVPLAESIIAEARRYAKRDASRNE